MVRGEFILGRPFLRGEVVIPWVDPGGRPREGRAELVFLVDTGTEQTVLCPRDYRDYLEIPLSAAPLLTSRLSGVGGRAVMRGIAGSLRLQEDG